MVSDFGEDVTSLGAGQQSPPPGKIYGLVEFTNTNYKLSLFCCNQGNRFKSYKNTPQILKKPFFLKRPKTVLCHQHRVDTVYCCLMTVTVEPLDTVSLNTVIL